MMTRRNVLKTAGMAAIVGMGTPLRLGLFAQSTPTPTGPFSVPPLGYAFDALEPHIDAQTMQIHHDKHHAAYVTNLNKAVSSAPDLATKSPEELLRSLNDIPEAIRTAVRNHGGGHYNHTIFWKMMSGSGKREPSGELLQALEARFGTVAAFKEQFGKAAAGQFGSGWAWLVYKEKQLSIEPTANQDNPISRGGFPLLGIDVWEHAYYLKYQNRRPDYVKAWFNVINWDFVADQFAKARAL